MSVVKWTATSGFPYYMSAHACYSYSSIHATRDNASRQNRAWTVGFGAHELLLLALVALDFYPLLTADGGARLAE